MPLLELTLVIGLILLGFSSLLKSLGGPKRLALLADGESMLNDATAVVLFRIVAAIVVGGVGISHETIAHSLLEFSYVFVGSIVAGAVFGYFVSLVLAKIDNNMESLLLMI